MGEWGAVFGTAPGSGKDVPGKCTLRPTTAFLSSADGRQNFTQSRRAVAANEIGLTNHGWAPMARRFVARPVLNNRLRCS